MKHIKTPVRSSAVSRRADFDTGSARWFLRLRDADEKIVADMSSLHHSSQSAADDPLANELARAINAHDALVEALEVALRNVRHLSNCPAHIASLRPAGPCDCGADDAKERVYDALILASGEQE